MLTKLRNLWLRYRIRQLHRKADVLAADFRNCVRAAHAYHQDAEIVRRESAQKRNLALVLEAQLRSTP
jgi:vacuolar-type H+-ATPase subunit D/Vma8